MRTTQPATTLAATVVALWATFAQAGPVTVEDALVNNDPAGVCPGRGGWKSPPSPGGCAPGARGGRIGVDDVVALDAHDEHGVASAVEDHLK